MRNFTTEMKKNALRIIAGAMTAISLTAAPLTVSAAELTNKSEDAIESQILVPRCTPGSPFLLSTNMESNTSKSIRDGIFIGNAAELTNKSEDAIRKQISIPRRQPGSSFLLSTDMEINTSKSMRDGVFIGNAAPSEDACLVTYYTLDDYDLPAIYPGEYITNDFDEEVNLVFFDSDVDYYVMVTIPAGGDYLVQYQESASGITVETPDYWDCFYVEDDYFFFMPNTGV